MPVAIHRETMIMHRFLHISAAHSTMMPNSDGIINLARISNRATSLTGLLVFDDNRFLQYLEGYETAVRSLYAKTRADICHYAVVKIRESQGEERQFADWEMAMVSGISTAEFEQSRALRAS